jgi:AraC-like DNA-binding protein
MQSSHTGGFAAWTRVTELGALRLHLTRFPLLQADRTPRLVRQSDPEMFTLAWARAGRNRIAQERTETALRPADFTLLDTSRPFRLSGGADSTGRQSDAVNLLIPHRLVPLPADKVRSLLAERIPSGQGMAVLLAQYLRQLTEHPEQYQPSDAPFLATLALDLIAATLAQHLDTTSSLPTEVQHRVLRARIDAFIDHHIADPDLSPRTIATAHHISIRTLHRLFQTDYTTVAELIRTRRLHRCRQDLTNPLLRGHPIYAIAARCGFPDNTVFSRLFRATFGMSPRQYREQ